ncbi:hypothetical protein MACK_003969 [Theileria orientalis]|uniref:Uncharacterized protein n=1 Tax=Theileria orientalis TaxID=68886 RepID=A0A976SJP5_THEOR|nr:hypothetical protein MACK_003969 [Theileria orientalis]
MRYFNNKHDNINIFSLKCQNYILTHDTNLGNIGSPQNYEGHNTPNII